MMTDIEIAQSVEMKPITEIADAAESDLHLIKGDFVECVNKANDGKPLTALVFCKPLDDQLDTKMVSYLVSVTLHNHYSEIIILDTYDVFVGSAIAISWTESGLALNDPRL